MVIMKKVVPAGGDRHRAPVETPLEYSQHPPLPPLSIAYFQFILENVLGREY